MVAANQAGSALQGQQETFPTVAELEAQIDDAHHTARRRKLVCGGAEAATSRFSRRCPKKPTLVDFFKLRFSPGEPRAAERHARDEDRHEGRSDPGLPAARRRAQSDQGRITAGGAHSSFEPYVPEKTSFAIRYHQTLRFYPDEEAGYEYPDSYHRTFGVDYVPPPHIQAAYKMLKNHKWYMEPRLVTVNDLYAFDPKAVVTHRSVHRHHRTPLQAAEGRARERQQPGRPHVADDGESRQPL